MEETTVKEDNNSNIKINEVAKGLDIISIILVVGAIIGIAIVVLLENFGMIVWIIVSSIIIISIIKGIAEIIQLLENLNNK